MGAPLTRVIDGQRLEFRAEPYRGQRDLRICEIFVKRERTRWVFMGYTRRLGDGSFRAYPRQRQGNDVRSPADATPLAPAYSRRSDAIVALWQEYRGGFPLEYRPAEQARCHFCQVLTSYFTRLAEFGQVGLCSECALTHRPAEIF